MSVEAQERSATRKAWGIHVFTATGAVCGLLGLLSVLDGSPRAAMLWLMGALVIDGIDGPMARRVDVRLHVPNVDGNVLDLVIDYVTCVVAPAVFLHRFDMLPRGGALLGSGLVMVTALYCFSRVDLMTDDHYFNGFPAMWGLVVNVLWVLKSRPMVNMVVIVVLSAMTFTSVKFPHPIRVRDHRNVTMPVVVVWLLVMVLLTIGYPSSTLAADMIEIGGAAYLVWLAVVRTRRDTQRA